MALTPEETVAQQRKVLEKYKNVEPADASRRLAEDSALRDGVTTSTYDQVTSGGSPTGLAQGLGKFAQSRAQASSGQDTRLDAVNLAQASTRESVIGQKQINAVRGRASQVDDQEQILKRAIAQRAFDMGMTGKELALHSDAALADIGFQQTKKDFDAGRVTEQELKAITVEFARRSLTKKQDTEKLLIEMKNAAAIDIANGNSAAAKQRLVRYYESLKKQAKDAARAANNAAIVTGAFTVGGAVLGAVFGGGVGAAPGAAGGAALGAGVNKSMEN